jgi:hypothetical protein
MANALYDKGREKFLTGVIAYGTDAIKAVLVNIAGGHYTNNMATDEFLASIVAGDRVATSANFTTKTTAAGVAGADGVTFSLVTGAACGAIVLYKDTTDPATSPLIAYIDTATGLPVTPGGGNISITWDAVNKIFKL